MRSTTSRRVNDDDRVNDRRRSDPESTSAGGPSGTPSSDHPALEVKGLVKRFGDRTAVDRLDLTLRRGEVFALLGPNGAGKTTTVEICEGFTTPDAGTVRVLGLDPIADNDALRRRIGVMLQGGGAYPGARAEEMLRLVAAYSANPIDPDFLLEALGLTEVRRTSYRRLSGGQQQRLALACAVVGRPELVFLDEPTAGLDAHARLVVWELIDRLRADGVSVMLTTHLMDEAEHLADHVAIIDHGRVVADGTPADLTSTGAENELRFTAPRGLDLSMLVLALPEGYHCTEPNPGAYLVIGPMTPQVLATVTAWCAKINVLATDLRVETRSLEDVFLDLTGRALRP
ncbi:ABC transporter ATP-binding protein [Gordonia terrae]|uniref:ABC transporter ATP-binding protein n=1 Tax=Gordonia terrae TaxID=2055 RepID=UPI003F6BC0D9